MRRLCFVLLAIVTIGLTGCAAVSSQPASVMDVPAKDHGGGVAVFRNGEFLSIDKGGQVRGHCLLCDAVDQGQDKCALKAKSLGIQVCDMPSARASGAAPRDTLMCNAYGPYGPLPPVPFGTPGYTCYMVSRTSCTCFQN